VIYGGTVNFSSDLAGFVDMATIEMLHSIVRDPAAMADISLQVVRKKDWAPINL